jgi:hypothetical protein
MTYSVRDISIVVGAAAGFIAISAFAMPLLRSDPPPFANVQRADAARLAIKEAVNAIRADLYYNRVFMLRSGQCSAIKENNRVLAETIGEQLSEAERVYMMLTGTTVSIRPCDEF